MRKAIVLTIAIVMMLTLAACDKANESPGADSANPPSVSGSESPADTAEEETPEQEEAPEQDIAENAPASVTKNPPESPAAADGGISAYPLSGVVVVDDKNCTFTVKSIDENGEWGFTLKALCENKTDKILEFTWDDVSVNGYMLDPYWYAEVAAGKKSNTEISFTYEQFEQCGITTVYDVEFTLRVCDTDDWYADDLVSAGYVLYPTGSDSFVYPERVPAMDEQVIVNNNDFLFIIEGISYDSYWEEYILDVYIENKSINPLEFAWDNVSVNGFMIDTYWYEEVAAGKRAYSEIYIYGDDLEMNDIAVIEEIEFAMSAYRTDDWYASDIYNGVSTYKPQKLITV